MKNNVFQDTELASSEDHDERDRIEWEKLNSKLFEPVMSRKAIAWGFVLTVAVIYAGLKLWTVLR